MTTRLQVLFEDDEFAEIKRVAKRHRMTVAEWVRQSLRHARRNESGKDPKRKLAVLREAAKHRFPAPPIERMLAEIEQGYLSGVGP